MPKEPPSALAKAMKFLAARPLSEFELLTKLRRAGYPDHECDNAIAECVKRHYLDDSQLTADCVDLLHQRNLGARQIKQKLLRRGLDKEEITGMPAMAIQLKDGRIVRGKTSDLLGPSASALLNAAKALSGIPKPQLLISPSVIEPIQELKIKTLGNKNPRLHSDETLLALAICAGTDLDARAAMEALKDLKGCEAHSTVIVPQVDEDVYRKLGINLTCEPRYDTNNRLFHK